jgi:hypothetical protein
MVTSATTPPSNRVRNSDNVISVCPGDLLFISMNIMTARPMNSTQPKSDLKGEPRGICAGAA